MDYKIPELLTSYHVGELMNTATGFQSVICTDDGPTGDDAVCG